MPTTRSLRALSSPSSRVVRSLQLPPNPDAAPERRRNHWQPRACQYPRRRGKAQSPRLATSRRESNEALDASALQIRSLSWRDAEQQLRERALAGANRDKAERFQTARRGRSFGRPGDTSRRYLGRSSPCGKAATPGIRARGLLLGCGTTRGPREFSCSIRGDSHGDLVEEKPADAH